MQMQAKRMVMIAAGVVLSAALSGSTPAWGQHLDAEPAHMAGQGITPAFEGWFRNPGRDVQYLVGYYNRNLKQTIDIPVGPDNKIEPGGPDQGQPTHFQPGRGWGPWSITVPKDFGDKELNWTITANGQTNTIPINIKPLWEISPFIDAINNTPPWLSFQNFDENGPTITGPKPLYISKTAKVGTPLPLTVFVADDVVISPGRTAPANPITVAWSEYRGPAGAAVKFSSEKPKVEKADFKKIFPKVGLLRQGRY